MPTAQFSPRGNSKRAIKLYVHTTALHCTHYCNYCTYISDIRGKYVHTVGIYKTSTSTVSYLLHTTAHADCTVQAYVQPFKYLNISPSSSMLLSSGSQATVARPALT